MKLGITAYYFPRPVLEGETLPPGAVYVDYYIDPAGDPNDYRWQTFVRAQGATHLVINQPGRHEILALWGNT